MAANDSNTKARSSLHPLMLMFVVLLLCVIASYLIPAGQYERVYDEEVGKDLIVPGSFIYITRTPLGIMQLLTSVTLGLQSGADIIFFLLIIGGVFAILNGNGALNIALANLMRVLKKQQWLIIPIFMIIFGCGATFCGNFEEFLIFVPLILACALTAGYDSLTAVAIIFVAATAGYAGAITNIFTLGNAQLIAGLPVFSGFAFHVVMFIALEAVSIAYVLFYAHYVKTNPKRSYSYEFDTLYNQEKKLNLEELPKLTKRQWLSIGVFILAVGIAVWGIIVHGFYVDELSGIFLAAGLIGGLIGGLRPNDICDRFIKGCHDMLLPAVMIGLSHACVNLLRDANVFDTILYAMASLLEQFPKITLPWGMFFFHTIFNVIVPSGSAQAATTMPLMVPLADAVGISRQTAVLAYTLGDAFTNVLTPTSGEVLAALAICRVPFSKWIKFIIPLFLIWCGVAMIFLMFANLSGF